MAAIDTYGPPPPLWLVSDKPEMVAMRIWAQLSLTWPAWLLTASNSSSGRLGTLACRHPGQGRQPACRGLGPHASRGSERAEPQSWACGPRDGSTQPSSASLQR
jgi:hypothetical protein